VTRPAIPNPGACATSPSRRLVMSAALGKPRAAGTRHRSSCDPFGLSSQEKPATAPQTTADGIFSMHRIASATRMFCRLGFGVGWRRPVRGPAATCGGCRRPSGGSAAVRWCENPFSHALWRESVPARSPDCNPGDGACEMGISHEQSKHWRTSRQWHPARGGPVAPGAHCPHHGRRG